MRSSCAPAVSTRESATAKASCFACCSARHANHWSRACRTVSSWASRAAFAVAVTAARAAQLFFGHAHLCCGLGDTLPLCVEVSGAHGHHNGCGFLLGA